MHRFSTCQESNQDSLMQCPFRNGQIMTEFKGNNTVINLQLSVKYCKNLGILLTESYCTMYFSVYSL